MGFAHEMLYHPGGRRSPNSHARSGYICGADHKEVEVIGRHWLAACMQCLHLHKEEACGQDGPHGNLQLLGVDGAGAICVKQVECLPGAASLLFGNGNTFKRSIFWYHAARNDCSI